LDWADRIGRRVRLRDLHVLMAVAESRSMSKASKALAISHPVVSKTISDLELTLGVQLFDRHSQGVELTPYGRAILDCGVAVFDEMRRGLKRVDYLTNPTSGELRIIMIAGVVPAIVERFSRQYPGIRLHVLAMRAFHELRARNVELIIGRTQKPFVEADLAVETLFVEPFVVVSGSRNKWARRRRLRLADLVEAPWVLPPYDSVPGSLIADMFRAEKVAPPVAHIVSLSAQLTTALLAGGHFVGMLPSSVMQFSSGRVGLQVLPIKLPFRQITADIITVKNRTLNPLAKLFLHCARQVAAVSRS
jgi:DNA-binding transcriptional LysR family regulator